MYLAQKSIIFVKIHNFADPYQHFKLRKLYDYIEAYNFYDFHRAQVVQLNERVQVGLLESFQII